MIKILLIDDDESFCMVTKSMLQEIGYHHVVIARSGTNGLRAAQKEKPSLILLDIVMPGMSGGETYDRLKGINPNVKVLLSSGYSMDGQASEILKRGCSGFIQKPFRMRHLSQIIREILDKE